MGKYHFTELILLIGTNPLPNFVVAEYFLQNNPKLDTIWVVHSKENQNIFQASTNPQAENLEKLLRKRWKDQKQHQSLQFPLQKIGLSDASNAEVIRREIQATMLTQIKARGSFHFDYTGGTKSMSTQVYWLLKNLQKNERQSFSYLDARNFRLLSDNGKIIVDTLRQKVSMTFEELLDLHGFQRCNENRTTDYSLALAEIEGRINSGRSFKNIDGKLFEDYIAGKLREHLQGKLYNQEGVLQHWEIKKPAWKTHFELDIMVMHGYQLTVMLCTTAQKKGEYKKDGFEVLLRTSQIGGDEAKSVLFLPGIKSIKTGIAQEELIHETGASPQNILVLGYEDIVNTMNNKPAFFQKIETFIFGT